jgi:hypothetical protein
LLPPAPTSINMQSLQDTKTRTIDRSAHNFACNAALTPLSSADRLKDKGHKVKEGSKRASNNSSLLTEYLLFLPCSLLLLTLSSFSMLFMTVVAGLASAVCFAATTPVSRQSGDTSKAPHLSDARPPRITMPLNPGRDAIQVQSSHEASRSMVIDGSSTTIQEPGLSTPPLEAKERTRANRRKWNQEYNHRKRLGAVLKKGRPAKHIDPSDPLFEEKQFRQERRHEYYLQEKIKTSSNGKVMKTRPGKMLRKMGVDIRTVDWTKLPNHDSFQRSSSDDATTMARLGTHSSPSSPSKTSTSHSTAPSASTISTNVDTPSGLDAWLETASWGHAAATT